MLFEVAAFNFKQILRINCKYLLIHKREVDLQSNNPCVSILKIMSSSVFDLKHKTL